MGSYQARAVVTREILLTDLDQPPKRILPKHTEIMSRNRAEHLVRHTGCFCVLTGMILKLCQTWQPEFTQSNWHLISSMWVLQILLILDRLHFAVLNHTDTYLFFPVQLFSTRKLTLRILLMKLPLHLCCSFFVLFLPQCNQTLRNRWSYMC